MLSEESRYKLLKALDANPGATQRELAKELGISVGKVNYCLKALIEKGWIKISNFAKSPNKMGYFYILTPKGIEEKASVTSKFLKRKMQECEQLKKEIDLIRQDVELSTTNSRKR